MTTAFVLINCEAGFEDNIMKNLYETEEVKEVQETIGSYDILIKVVSPTTHELRKIIFEKIRSQEKIRSSQILIRTGDTNEFV